MENFNKGYFDYINSDKWRFIRRQVAEKNNYMCQLCHKKMHKGFHIHHITYENFGHEKLSDLMFLCPECHLMRIHKQYKKKPKKIKNNKKKKEKEPLISDEEKQKFLNLDYYLKYFDKLSSKNKAIVSSFLRKNNKLRGFSDIKNKQKSYMY